MSVPLRVSGEFVTGARGPLAVVLWEPPTARASFAALYLPPFADEMNKSRRMAAMQARAFAAMGGVVALLDPYGTGDSGGNHIDASWEGWQDDAVCVFDWLARRAGVTPLLWGLRLGALLAAQLVARARLSPAALVLWQPVLRGSSFVSQFLRLATVQQRVDGGSDGIDAAGLRTALAAGNSVEVAGYDVSPDLLRPLEQSDLEVGDDIACPIVWRDVAGSATLSPATEAWAGRLRARGLTVNVEAVPGPSFWATQEIEEAPALVAATSAAVAGILDLAAERSAP